MKHAPWMILPILMTLVIAGCDSRDERLAEFAQKSTAEQAAQNRAAAETARETAETARQAAENQRRTLEAMEKSRQELIAQQREQQQELAQQRSVMDKQRSTIDLERRDLADERHRESMLAPVFTSIGFLLVTALPLVLCWYLLHTLKDAPVDETSVTQLLVQDLISDQPILLSPPHPPAGRITHTIPEPPRIEDQPPST